MSRLIRPDLAQMPSFLEALREGYSRDTLRAETPESIAEIAADQNPQAVVENEDMGVGLMRHRRNHGR